MKNYLVKSISWQAPEFRHYEKNAGWYIVLVAVTILFSGFFVIVEEDYFAASTTLILAVLIALFSRHKPKTVDIELSGKGVRFENILFPYKQIKYFWVVHNENHQTVNFHTNALLNNTVILELAGQDPDEVRNFLLMHLPEHEETRETFVQRIIHKFKF